MLSNQTTPLPLSKPARYRVFEYYHNHSKSAGWSLGKSPAVALSGEMDTAWSCIITEGRGILGKWVEGIHVSLEDSWLIYGIHLTTNFTQYLLVRWSVDHELEIIWKEVVLICLIVLTVYHTWKEWRFPQMISVTILSMWSSAWWWRMHVSPNRR